MFTGFVEPLLSFLQVLICKTFVAYALGFYHDTVWMVVLTSCQFLYYHRWYLHSSASYQLGHVFSW
jgi:hypothetical protein